MKKKILDRQTLWDIALKSMGGISGIFELAEQEDLSLTEELTAGREIDRPRQTVNREVTKYYETHQWEPATGITIDVTSGDGALLLEGIEFWGIEYDFIIS